jgi:hypothetical protein
LTMTSSPLSATQMVLFSARVYLYLWQSPIQLHMASICIYFECALKFSRLLLGK